MNILRIQLIITDQNILKILSKIWIKLFVKVIFLRTAKNCFYKFANRENSVVVKSLCPETYVYFGKVSRQVKFCSCFLLVVSKKQKVLPKYFSFKMEQFLRKNKTFFQICPTLRHIWQRVVCNYVIIDLMFLLKNIIVLMGQLSPRK